ncbi:ADR019Cp [Eremothecium gossypii ATCC 10895]|uniref:ADR019Cp n=1 Tax=Eremothecium gossypii (strain ATCC 10895 / CBS 109.51 / FGSC 9923 / NRRL Y-1056) TaxID=284811 RepID=Q75A99_EREGS|nr:ADR019Cp [Eremothecium gossypii ATCC 10895]AAS51939.1 ADR019Cp [Eremothecium gossypii ATCC 10895]AEY96239.1 FADR019Cp [Eremothecium gossypii FDAG1]
MKFQSAAAVAALVATAVAAVDKLESSSLDVLFSDAQAHTQDYMGFFKPVGTHDPPRGLKEAFFKLLAGNFPTEADYEAIDFETVKNGVKDLPWYNDRLAKPLAAIGGAAEQPAKTEAPASSAPASSAPAKTEAPASSAPASSAPAKTEAPASSAPASSAPASSAPPAPASSAPAASTSSHAVATKDGAANVLPWSAGLGVVVAGAIGMLM